MYFSVNVSNGKQVLSAYTLRTLLTAFYPGISSLCMKMDDANAEYLYGALAPSERSDAAFTQEKRAVLQSLTLTDRGELNSRVRVGSGFGSKSSTPGNGNGYGTVGGVIPNPNRLTKEKLKELDMSFTQYNGYGPRVPLDGPPNPSIRVMVGEKVLDPVSIAVKSMETSNHLSRGRRKRLAHRIKDLTSLFN
jgi:hypothetical protein